ncbi:hypothetical protein CPC08DRAFT_216177 [Agrocybe pediades]|nr:hypothetical protein CPC08DRAFT_216177 [Agrocybe pediades]
MDRKRIDSAHCQVTTLPGLLHFLDQYPPPRTPPPLHPYQQQHQFRLPSKALQKNLFIGFMKMGDRFTRLLLLGHNGKSSTCLHCIAPISVIAQPDSTTHRTEAVKDSSALGFQFTVSLILSREAYVIVDALDFFSGFKEHGSMVLVYIWTSISSI